MQQRIMAREPAVPVANVRLKHAYEKRWPEFRRHYTAEIREHPDLLNRLRAQARKATELLLDSKVPPPP